MGKCPFLGILVPNTTSSGQRLGPGWGEAEGAGKASPTLGKWNTIPHTQLNERAIKSKNDSNSAVNIMWLRVK